MAKILVIDDEEDMRILMCAILSRGDHEVESVADGESGLAIVASMRPDLILCDISMRGMSGYEVLSKLRTMPEAAHTPVVLVTGMADLKGMREGMKLGADDYLPKPFTVSELLSVVRTRLEKTESLRKEAEERAKSLRSNISFMLPQELLNPLTGILGLAGILCDEADILRPDEAADLARDIQRSGDRLNRLINNFLIYSQIELLATEPARIEALRAAPPTPLGRALDSVMQRVSEKHRREVDVLVETCEADVAVSEQNLDKILGEIIDNAFKFSRSGTTVRVDAVTSGEFAVIRVSDEGKGMSPQVLDAIRNVGQMEHFSAQKRSEGLGLAIALRLAEIHGGKIAVEEREGPGTTIRLALPLASVTRSNP